jgi:hypothetical protein
VRGTKRKASVPKMYNNKRSPEAIKRRKEKLSNDIREFTAPIQRFDAYPQQKFQVHLPHKLDKQFRDSLRLQHPYCDICGWDVFNEALEIHHKNKNPSDNRVENLVVLCPNCHTLIHLELIELGTPWKKK